MPGLGACARGAHSSFPQLERTVDQSIDNGSLRRGSLGSKSRFRTGSDDRIRGLSEEESPSTLDRLTILASWQNAFPIADTQRWLSL